MLQTIRRREGVAVLSGDIGTGKTTVCRTVLKQLDMKLFTSLVLNPFLSAEELLREDAVESMLYRIAGSLDAAIGGSDENTALLAALEEFAVEASIVKVAGSEMLDFVVDENVQAV